METDPKQNRPSWQATKAAETRQRILDSALEVIAEKGVGALTIDAVVQQSGITKGGLQYHFASKEALAFGVLQQASAAFLAGISAAAGGSGDSAWARSLVEYGFRDDPADIGLWKPLIEMLGYAGEVKALSEGFYAEIMRRLHGAGLSREDMTVLMLSLEGYSTSPLDLPPGTGEILRGHFLRLLEHAKEDSQ